MVVSTREALAFQLEDLLANPEKMTALGKRAFAFARANHDRSIIQMMLKQDIKAALPDKGVAVR